MFVTGTPVGGKDWLHVVLLDAGLEQGFGRQLLQGRLDAHDVLVLENLVGVRLSVRATGHG